MGYLWANFSLPKPLCSRVRPDVCDRRQTDRRQTKASLNASALWGGGIKTVKPMHGCIVVTGEQTNKRLTRRQLLYCYSVAAGVSSRRTAASERLDNITTRVTSRATDVSRRNMTRWLRNDVINSRRYRPTMQRPQNDRGYDHYGDGPAGERAHSD